MCIINKLALSSYDRNEGNFVKILLMEKICHYNSIQLNYSSLFPPILEKLITS